jgi:hypothetical protein
VLDISLLKDDPSEVCRNDDQLVDPDAFCDGSEHGDFGFGAFHRYYEHDAMTPIEVELVAAIVTGLSTTRPARPKQEDILFHPTSTRFTARTIEHRPRSAA